MPALMRAPRDVVRVIVRDGDADATVDDVAIDRTSPNALERAVKASKRACMARLNARMGVPNEHGDGDDDDDARDDDDDDDDARCDADDDDARR